MNNLPHSKRRFADTIINEEKERVKVLSIRWVVFVSIVLFITIGILITRTIQEAQIASKIPKIVSAESVVSSNELPEYSGSPYVIINNNIPIFDDNSFDVKKPFEYYSELDSLGRCQTAFANLCKELEPSESRSSISEIYPTGWNNQIYEQIDEGYLFNRCHLIGFQLTGENDNEKNLITGTRYFNVEGMLPFENKIREYIDETENHVLYRVTPIYTKKNLLADGVQIEALSVEDKGKRICLNVFVYNVQPGIVINYANGESKED